MQTKLVVNAMVTGHKLSDNVAVTDGMYMYKHLQNDATKKIMGIETVSRKD